MLRSARSIKALMILFRRAISAWGVGAHPPQADGSVTIDSRRQRSQRDPGESLIYVYAAELFSIGVEPNHVVFPKDVGDTVFEMVLKYLQPAQNAIEPEHQLWRADFLVDVGKCLLQVLDKINPTGDP